MTVGQLYYMYVILIHETVSCSSTDCQSSNEQLCGNCDALQLEAAQRQANHFSTLITTPILSFKVVSLSVAILERFTADTLRYAVTLTFNPVTLT